MTQTVDLKIPGSVYYDCLDPLATDMEKDLGLAPYKAGSRKMPRGHQFLYNNVPLDVAKDVADWFQDRADLMLSNADGLESRDKYCHYAERKAAAKLREQIAECRQTQN